MFSPALDVAISLIFIYLLLGLITTAAQELIAAKLNLRGRKLRDAVTRLIADGDKHSQLFSDIFRHPIITTTSKKANPSYIPSTTFALAVVDALSKGGALPVFSQVEQAVATLPPGKARDSLGLLIRDAAGNLDSLKASIANWFDDAMDRVSGEYKRQSQTIALCLGIALAIGLNVDSIGLANRLWQDRALRENTVASAQAFVAANPSPPVNLGSAQAAGPANAQNAGAGSAIAPPPTPTSANNQQPPSSSTLSSTDTEATRSAITENLKTLDSLALPIGWDGVLPCPRAVQPSPSKPAPACTPDHHIASPYPEGSLKDAYWRVKTYLGSLGTGGVLLLLIGWLLSGLAVSLGAPFWFDLLQQVLNLRGTGPKPARADGTGETA